MKESSEEKPVAEIIEIEKKETPVVEEINNAPENIPQNNLNESSEISVVSEAESKPSEMGTTDSEDVDQAKYA